MPRQYRPLTGMTRLYRHLAGITPRSTMSPRSPEETGYYRGHSGKTPRPPKIGNDHRDAYGENPPSTGSNRVLTVSTKHPQHRNNFFFSHPPARECGWRRPAQREGGRSDPLKAWKKKRRLPFDSRTRDVTISGLRGSRDPYSSHQLQSTTLATNSI